MSRWGIGTKYPAGGALMRDGRPSAAPSSRGRAGVVGRGPLVGWAGRWRRPRSAPARREGFSGNSSHHSSVALACAARGACLHRRWVSARADSANRHEFETPPSQLPRALREHRQPSLTCVRMEGHSRSEKLSASPPLFKSEFLNFFSRVHPAVPAVVFVPVVVAMEWIGADRGYALWQLALLTLGGVGVWTLTEYWLHRLVFHWEPDNAFGRRMHFIIHGIHHDHPNDKMRLVMPPSVSIPLAALFFAAFWLILGDAAFPVFAGFIAGYLFYDYTHYYVHHFVPRTDFGKRLREHHMRHHFQDHRYGYGVSTPFWDYAFRTQPRKRSKYRG